MRDAHEAIWQCVLDACVKAVLKRADFLLGLADQIAEQEPGGQRHIDGLHDRCGGERGLMLTATAWKALEAATTDMTILTLKAARS